MSITITPLRHEFAGEVSGIDCTRPLSAEAVRAIRDGMDRYGVLVLGPAETIEQAA